MVTLATNEFGKNIYSLLALKGYNLLISGRNKDKLITLQKKKLQKEYPKISVQSVIIDFSDNKTIEIAAHNVSQPLQGIVLMRPRPVMPLSTTKIPTKEEWTHSFQ